MDVSADFLLFVFIVMAIGGLATLVAVGMDLSYPQGNAVRKPAIMVFGISWFMSGVSILILERSAEYFIHHNQWPWYYFFAFLVFFVPLAVIVTIRLPAKLSEASKMDERFYAKEAAFLARRAGSVAMNPKDYADE